MNNLLTIKNLSVLIDKKTILKNINLTVRGGEIHAIMGPNGSGKSTLAMAIAGHPNYTIGKASKLKLNGSNLLKLSPDKRAKLGLFLAFQQPLAIPGVSAINLLRLAKNPNDATTNNLSFSHFLSDLKKIAGELQLSEEMFKRSLNDGFSGGEKKKMEALQAVYLRPKVAIFDEIDTGLDVDSLKLVGRAIKKLLQNKTSIILVTHYHRLLKYIKPDHVHLLINGQIKKSGPATLARLIEKTGYEPYLS